MTGRPKVAEELAELRARRLKYVMDLWQITGRDLADAIGKAPQQISYVLKQKRPLGEDMAMLVAEALNTREDFFPRHVSVPYNMLTQEAQKKADSGELLQDEDENYLVPQIKGFVAGKFDPEYLLGRSSTMWRKVEEERDDRIEAFSSLIEAVERITALSPDIRIHFENLPNPFTDTVQLEDIQAPIRENWVEFKGEKYNLTKEEAFLLLKRYIHAINAVTTAFVDECRIHNDLNEQRHRKKKLDQDYVLVEAPEEADKKPLKLKLQQMGINFEPIPPITFVKVSEAEARKMKEQNRQNGQTTRTE